MSIDRFTVLKAYLGTRQAHRRLRTRDDIERRQAKLWQAFAPVISRTPALSALAGSPLQSFPVMTPRDVRERFNDWNTLGLMRAIAHAAAEEAERGGAGKVAPGVSAGFSTGTSGSRGIFLANREERARYLGQALAKLLPWDGLLRPRRIALCLRADSALYRDVKNAGPFQFRFFELARPVGDWIGELEEFDPHVFIAPSHVLAELSGRTEDQLELPSLQRLFYGAEPMGDDERVWVERQLGMRPDPIYQATEGFLGASCRYGTLHLNEDSLIIERTPVAGTNRFMPIVTDLRRTTQPMVRVQLDDLIEVMDEPCLCGSPLLAVRGVEGRVRDVWRWGGVVVAPRDVVTAVVMAVGPAVEWRAVAGPSGVVIEAATNAQAAAAALTTLLQQRGVAQGVTVAPLTAPSGFKRQRVRWLDA